MKKPEMEIEDLEMELIDAGLEEIKIEDDENISIYADYTDFGNMSSKLEELGLEYEKGSLERVPNAPIEITDEQMEELSLLLEKLEDDEDVQSVYTNLE